MGSQQFCLKWNNHQLNMLSMFDELLHNEAFVDVTLACDGLSLKAHKMVLSACSPYFKHLFMQNPCQHPIVILKDVRYDDLKAIVDFMYKGEVNVSQEELSVLLRTAETLKVKGLAEVTGGTGGGGGSPSLPPAAAAAASTVSQSGTNHPAMFEGGNGSSSRAGRTSPPAKRKKRHGGALAAALGAPGNALSASGHIQQVLASLQFPVTAPETSTATSTTPSSDKSHGSRGLRLDCVEDVDDIGDSKSRSSDEGGGGGCPGGVAQRLRQVHHYQQQHFQQNRQAREPPDPGVAIVKEDRDDSELDDPLEEPPDGLDDLVMESAPEHLEIEPMAMNADPWARMPGGGTVTSRSDVVASMEASSTFASSCSTTGRTGGRPSDPIREYFLNDTEPDDGYGGRASKVTCRSCGAMVSARAERMKNHLNKCPTAMAAGAYDAGGAF